jgi:hypothetical protein
MSTTRFDDPASRAESSATTAMKRYDRSITPTGRMPKLLVFPRADPGPLHETMEPFHQVALELPDQHILFDVKLTTSSRADQGGVCAGLHGRRRRKNRGGETG